MLIKQATRWSIVSGWNLFLLSATAGALIFTIGAVLEWYWLELIAAGQGVLVAFFALLVASYSWNQHRHPLLSEYLAFCSIAAGASGSVGMLYALNLGT